MMARHLEEMPLFPLNTVVFPHASLSLHIFEERYRSMIRDCFREDRPFGIVLIRSGEEVGGMADPYLVGTAVRITKLYPNADGTMDIQVTGERRFRIREIDDSLPHLVGKVEPLVEVSDLDGFEAASALVEAREQFRIFIDRMFNREDFHVQVTFPHDPVALSFTIANFLTLGNLEKQRLLETTDTLERVQTLIPLMQRQNLEMESRNTVIRLTSTSFSDWVSYN